MSQEPILENAPQAPQPDEETPVIRIPKYMLFVGFLFLGVFVWYVLSHLSEAQQLAVLLQHARPELLLGALALQIGTYICAGAVWNRVFLDAGHHVRVGGLARLAVEKLSINQLVPTGGVSGNLVAFHAMKRMGLPHSLSMEAVLVDVLGHYIAYGTVAVTALAVLWHHHEITPVVRSIAAIFAAVLVTVPASILILLAHKESLLPKRMLHFAPMVRLRSMLKEVSAQRVREPKLLAAATLLNIAIFLLDSATLWVVMYASGFGVSPVAAFVALVVGSIGGTLSLVPGGIGGFEAGTVLALTLFGTPVEAALTGTLLLRGFTLWLPLIPGVLLTRRDARFKV